MGTRLIYVIAAATVGGAVLFAALLVVVIMTGQTFGQRCTVNFTPSTPQWDTCVRDLAFGRKP